MQIPKFSDANVLVAGDVMLDRYWKGHAKRISPESPVPVVSISDSQDKPGGAGNVAVNVASLGASVSLLGVVGVDEQADILRKTLVERGIESNLVQSESIPTVTKLRVLSRNQQMIRLDFEQKVPQESYQLLARHFEASVKHYQAVILSDYGKGTLVDPALLIEQARKENKPVLVDPKGNNFARYRGATLLTPNRKEFELVMGNCDSAEALYEKGKQALDEYDLEALLVTRSEEGMTLFQRDKDPLHLPAYTKEVFDVTGAGDTVIALIAATLAAGHTLEHAVVMSNIAASIVVTKMGAASVTPTELRQELNRLQGLTTGVVDEKILINLVADAKAQGEKIVMTNGCFDILHLGHIHYLKQAKALGDRLIIAVNTDESVKQLKGPKRPINNLEQRMTLLAELGCVDWVMPFSELTPLRVVQAINPHVLVKGGDYTEDEVVGGTHVIANGGEVKIIDFVQGFSTTGLINAITEDMTE